jgi:hypothetical protein
MSVTRRAKPITIILTTRTLSIVPAIASVYITRKAGRAVLAPRRIALRDKNLTLYRKSTDRGDNPILVNSRG